MAENSEENDTGRHRGNVGPDTPKLGAKSWESQPSKHSGFVGMVIQTTEDALDSKEQSVEGHDMFIEEGEDLDEPN